MKTATERFHILFEDAIQEGFDKVKHMAFKMTTGMAREVLDYQGKVSYNKKDPFLLELGLTGDAANLLDENGDPIPETKPLVDPKMVRWILSRRRPDQYGNRLKESHEHKGGVDSTVQGGVSERSAWSFAQSPRSRTCTTPTGAGTRMELVVVLRGVPHESDDLPTTNAIPQLRGRNFQRPHYCRHRVADYLHRCA